MNPLRGRCVILAILCISSQRSLGDHLDDEGSSWSVYDSESCGSSEFWNSEFEQCEECPTCDLGHELDSECGYDKGEGAECIPCADGYYNNGSDIMCSPCAYCHNREQLWACTTTQNTGCGDCLPGFFFHESLRQCIPSRAAGRQPPVSIGFPTTTLAAPMPPPPTEPTTRRETTSELTPKRPPDSQSTLPGKITPSTTDTEDVVPHDGLEYIIPIVIFVAVLLLLFGCFVLAIIKIVKMVVGRNGNSGSYSSCSTGDRTTTESTPESIRKDDGNESITMGEIIPVVKKNEAPHIPLSPRAAAGRQQGASSPPHDVEADGLHERELNETAEITFHVEQEGTGQISDGLASQEPVSYPKLRGDLNKAYAGTPVLSPKTKEREECQHHATVITEISCNLESEKLRTILSFVQNGVPSFHPKTAEEVTSFDGLANVLSQLEVYSRTRPCVLVRGLSLIQRNDLSTELYKATRCELHTEQKCCLYRM